MIEITLKLSTGKELKLSQEELMEIKEMFISSVVVGRYSFPEKSTPPERDDFIKLVYSAPMA